MAKAAKAAKLRFRLMSSSHQDEHGKNYTKGDVVTSDRDLAKSFGATKFKRLRSGVPEEVELDDEEELEDDEELEDEDLDDEGEDEDEDNDPARDGEDVTADFSVTDESIKVFQFPGGYYNVTRDGDAVHAGKIRKTKVAQVLKDIQKKAK